jgi:aminomethyltransferase
MIESLQQTPLHTLHLEQQAKMVAFATYQMPVQYPLGIIREHQHTRNKAGLFDISHMGQMLLTGDQLPAALEKLSPGKISTLESGQQRYCVLTNDQGGIIDDLIITRFDSEYLLVVNAAQQKQVFTYLQMHLPDHCNLELLEQFALLALQGPKAAEVLKKFTAAGTQLDFMRACKTHINKLPCRIFRCGYTGEDGFEISVLAEHIEQLARLFLAQPEVELIGLGARDTLRLEAGLCLYGQDINTKTTPVEANLSWTVRKHANNFPGAKIIRHQIQNGPPQKLVGLVPETKAPIRAGVALLDADDEQVGHISSGGFSPSLKKPIAMGYINAEYAQTGHPIYTNLRNRRIAMSITHLPFVQHRYHHKST